MLLAVVLPLQSLACDSGGKLVMGCTTEKGKRIEVCQTKVGAVYTFGKKGAAPELRIADNGKNFRWTSSYGTSGGGELFEFVNGAYTYLFQRYEYRGADDEGTLVVMLRGKQISDFKCVEDRIDYNLDPLTRKESDDLY